jgi:hypothetical protein
MMSSTLPTSCTLKFAGEAVCWKGGVPSLCEALAVLSGLSDGLDWLSPGAGGPVGGSGGKMLHRLEQLVRRKPIC